MAILKSKPEVPEVIPTGKLMRLRPDQIKKSSTNPRHLFDPAEMNALKNSIRDKGVLVPITVFQAKGQSTFTILDGERRFRCVLELNTEGHDLDMPANVVEPPTKIAGLLYMFSIHNYREAWELMPTALGLKIVIDELREDDTKRLAKLTGLSESQVERCKKLLNFPEKFQLMSLDPDPQTRVPSNFWIEALPVIELVEKELPKIASSLGRDRITEKLVEKYRARKIKSVIHFRKIMEAYELSEDDKGLRATVIRRVQDFLLNPALETRDAFDGFVRDRKRVQSALEVCTDFLSTLQKLKLSYTADDTDRQQLRSALIDVERYCESLRRTLEGSDDPEVQKINQ
jgi:ParB family chromosome partitioning protein